MEEQNLLFSLLTKIRKERPVSDLLNYARTNFTQFMDYIYYYYNFNN